MLLWLAFAVLTAGVIGFLMRPLLRASAPIAAAESADLEVYRDQLNAIEAEREQGLLDEADAEAARAELARRMLRAAEAAGLSGSHEVAASAAKGSGKAADRKGTAQGAALPFMNRVVVYGGGAAIPMLAIAAYLAVGQPGLPDLPHAERLAQTKSGRSVEDLIGMVEARLRANPDDGQGWAVIAPVFMKQQRYTEAARAYANVLRLNGETPDALANFAEAMVFANNGLITPDARKAYQRMLALAPQRPEPKFWLALAKEQDGNVAEGITDLEAMLKDAPADAPWRPLVEGKLKEMRVALAGGTNPAPGASGGEAGANAGQPPQPPGGPSAADVAAVQQMSPEQRSEFIAQMVDGLAARLAKDGKDLEGWKRLLRAYTVMGRKGDAAKALGDARKAFDGDVAALDALSALAKDLGLGS